MNTLNVTAVVLVFLIAAFVWLFRKLASRSNGDVDRPEWFEDFSVESYAPMERLLDQRDIRFLKAQPGYRPEIGRQLLRERKRLLLEYLRQLTGDFNQLVQIGRLMVVYSNEDRVDFARALRRQQIAFYSAVGATRLRLAFYPLAGQGLDTTKLVAALENMHMRIQEIGRPLAPAEPA